MYNKILLHNIYYIPQSLNIKKIIINCHKNVTPAVSTLHKEMKNQQLVLIACDINETAYSRFC